jgi:hypothetical protein
MGRFFVSSLGTEMLFSHLVSKLCRDCSSYMKLLLLCLALEHSDPYVKGCKGGSETGSGAHAASYPMGTGGILPGVKRGRGVTLSTHFHLVLRSRMGTSYTPLFLQALPWRRVGLHYFLKRAVGEGV